MPPLDTVVRPRQFFLRSKKHVPSGTEESSGTTTPDDPWLSIGGRTSESSSNTSNKLSPSTNDHLKRTRRLIKYRNTIYVDDYNIHYIHLNWECYRDGGCPGRNCAGDIVPVVIVRGNIGTGFFVIGRFLS